MVDDFSSEDLSAAGLDVWVPDARNGCAVGAFKAGSQGSLRVRAVIQRLGGASQGKVRMRSLARGQERVGETEIAFDGSGLAVVDLRVSNVRLESVGVIEEEWVWETAEEEAGWVRHGTTRVRLYVTAGVPVNVVPRDSFYYVACAVGGATDQASAKKNVWKYFCNEDGKGMRSSRGQQLTMWKTGAADECAQRVCVPAGAGAGGAWGFELFGVGGFVARGAGDSWDNVAGEVYMGG